MAKTIATERKGAQSPESSQSGTIGKIGQFILADFQMFKRVKNGQMRGGGGGGVKKEMGEGMVTKNEATKWQGRKRRAAEGVQIELMKRREEGGSEEDIFNIRASASKPWGLAYLQCEAVQLAWAIHEMAE